MAEGFFAVERHWPKPQHSTGGYTHRAVCDADRGVGQAASQHAQIVSVQLRYRQDSSGGDVCHHGLLLGQVLRPRLIWRDAGSGCHEKNATTVAIVQSNRRVVHVRQVARLGNGFGHHHRFDGQSLLLSFLQGIGPFTLWADRRCDTGPALTTVLARGGDLSFEVARWNAQRGIQVAVGVQCYELADIFGSGANEKKVTLNLGDGALA